MSRVYDRRHGAAQSLASDDIEQASAHVRTDTCPSDADEEPRVTRPRKTAATAPRPRRPSRKAGRSFASRIALLGIAGFTLGLGAAFLPPSRILASTPTPAPLTRSTTRPTAPPAETETQPAGRARREAASHPVVAPSAAPHPQTSASGAPAGRTAARPEALPAPSGAPAAAAHAAPRAAVIIDDCGNNNASTRAFVEAPAPVTLAVLPHLAFSRQIAQEAKAHAKGVMLHFPMEATGDHDPGPGTLRVAMTETQKKKIIAQNLDALPVLDGVNNHEGSKATSDPETMRLLLRSVRDRGLFWVDSYTTPTSCAREVASSLRVSFARRDVFLDNVDDIEAVKENLRLLIREALEHGEAVGIGHARTTTATAFVEMIPAFEEAGVRLVLVRDLVRTAQADKEDKR